MTQQHSPEDKVKGYIQLAFVIAFIVVSFVASALLGVSKAPIRQETPAPRVLSVEAVQVTPGRHQITFSTTGLIKARAEVEISPEVSGRVISVNDSAFAGGTFEAGELLFQIEPKDYQLALRDAEAAVAQASAAYDLEMAESNLAIAEWKQIQGDRLPPALVARKPQLNEAKATLRAAQAQLSDATLDLERTVYSLPFKGRVITSALTPGQLLTAGQSYGTAYDMGSLEIQASLDAKKLSWLMETQDPYITVTTQFQGQEHRFKGALKRGASGLDSTTRFGQIAVALADNAIKSARTSAGLIPGLFADLDIKGPFVDDVVALPSTALQKGGAIWRINPATQTLHRADAEIIYSNGQTIFIRGIKGTSTIVTSKLPGGAQDMKVQYTLRPLDDALQPSTSNPEQLVMNNGY